MEEGGDSSETSLGEAGGPWGWPRPGLVWDLVSCVPEDGQHLRDGRPLRAVSSGPRAVGDDSTAVQPSADGIRPDRGVDE